MQLNKKDILALADVVDYMHDDELKHYEECIGTGDDEGTKYHIWHSILRLSLTLKEYNMKENTP